MKRVRCPKCDRYIIFDESKYKDGQSLVFQCDNCGKQFGIRIGVNKLHASQKNAQQSTEEENSDYGSLIVIENAFHYKQILKLSLGNNTIGRYQKGSKTKIQIETVDPSVDMLHCMINVAYDKTGKLVYTLSDGPSYTGTFVNNELIGNREKRIIYNDTLFTIGATSIILKEGLKSK